MPRGGAPRDKPVVPRDKPVVPRDTPVVRRDTPVVRPSPPDPMCAPSAGRLVTGGEGS